MYAKKQPLGKLSHTFQMNSKGGKRIVDCRDLAIIQTKLINTIESRSCLKNTMQLNALVTSGIIAQKMENATPTRTVSNRMRDNMQAALARLFGGPASRYIIDQASGSTFSDGAPNYTTGHHNVIVTDTETRTRYRCDFHQNGAYYTRGSEI